MFKKIIDSETVYIKNFLKTKIKSCGDEATDFHSKEMHKVGSNQTCLAVIKNNANYYAKVFLKE